MRLTDEQIERYSRQLILQEVGPRGQERLLAARVAVVGTGTAAERVVAHLAAAGVGRIAADPTLHVAVDPAQPDCTVETLAQATDPFDAVVVTDGDDLDAWHARAATVVWITDDGIGALPARPPSPRGGSPPADRTPVRDALLGTVVATEVVKALLGIGTPLTGRVVTYDPTTATIAARDPA